MSAFLFKQEVQAQFSKAGWYPDRDFSKHLEKVKGIKFLPDFLVSFFREFGGLYVPLLEHNDTRTLNLNDVVKGKFKLKENLKPNEFFGKDLYIFPIGQENDEGGMIYCDGRGNIYSLGSEVTLWVSKDFQDGIEKVIECNYGDSLAWDLNSNEWSKDF